MVDRRRQPNQPGGCDEGPEASVIVPAHNAAATIAQQLDALCAQDTRAQFEVIVVLNRCTDDTEARVASFVDHLDLHIVNANAKAGAAFARNVGASCSSSDRLLFCDADDVAGPGWVRSLTDGLNETDFVGGNLVIDLADVPRWKHPSSGTHPIAGGLHGWDARILYPITASFACRRDAFESVGGFDEDLRATEDTDLAIRLYRSGALMSFAPAGDLSYRPRVTLRDALPQSRNYALGDAKVALKEGHLNPTGRSRGLAQTAAAVLTKATRSRTLHPSALFLAGARAHYRSTARRHVAEGLVGRPVKNPIVDFVVEWPGSPTKWFALLGTREAGRSYFRTQPERLVLESLPYLLDPDETMLDFNPGSGAVAIVAAWSAGPNARIVCMARTADSWSLLKNNLMRHGVVDRVDRLEILDPSELPPNIGLVRLDRDLAASGDTSSYSRLLDQFPRARYLLPRSLFSDPRSLELVQRFHSGTWRLGPLSERRRPSGDRPTTLDSRSDVGSDDHYLIAEPT